MSTLVLIRHAQASFMEENYDQLSPLGYEQSRALGKYLIEKKLVPDRIYHGPLQRQIQTLEMVQEIYAQENMILPTPVLLENLLEHRGMEVMNLVIDDLIPRHKMLQKWAEDAASNPSARRKNHLRMFHYFMEIWAEDKLGVPHPVGFQPWGDFRKTVSEGIETIMQTSGKGETVWAFTSGGTIAASLGHALGMKNEAKIIDLNGKVKNASFSEFLFSNGRISLRSFNETPHLETNEMVTYV